MKTIKYMWMACVAFAAVSLTACSDDDGNSYPDGNAPVVVIAIYLEDADGTVKDRPVDFARLGQTIRLEGSGFGGTRHVLVNGYDTYFNTTLVTDRNMVLQLAATTPILSADPEYRNKIVFVKDGGAEYSCDLTIRAASPSISGISNSMPQPGETVIVYGANLQETTEIVLPGGVTLSGSQITSDEDGEWYSFVMPEGITEGGYISSTGANGYAQTPAFFNQTKGLILNFDGVGTQGFWSWSETGSMINSEDLVSDPLNSGRGNVVKIIPDRLLNDGIVPGKGRATECWTAGNDNAADDWTHFVTDGLFEESTPLDEIAFQFDVYCPQPWSGTGQIEISAQNNASWTGYGSSETKSSTTQIFVWVPWLNEDGTVTPFQTEGWQTVTIPLSKLSKYANMLEDGDIPVFKNIIDDRNAASYKNFGMGFVNTEITVGEVTIEAQNAKFEIYLDNWRIVPYKKVTISDFPDEEE